MSTTLGDSRLTENSKWTPEEDAILVAAVTSCESFRQVVLESAIYPSQPVRDTAGMLSRKAFPEGRTSPAESVGSILSIQPFAKVCSRDYVSVM